MGEVRYMISEAAKRVNMETHVLRHWEEELGLSIGRTEMGHRFYTEEDIRLFNCIKELKEQGMLLKELKELIPDMIKTREKRKATKTNQNCVQEKTEGSTVTDLQIALLENNKILKDAITESIMKEMGYLFMAQEEQEEARYKKLDCLIRQQQTYRKEYARSAPFKQLRKILEG